MKKPNAFDETKVSGDFTPIELGGHHMIIKKVEETQSSTGKAMLKVFLEMANNDSQPGYFANEFRNDIRADKKWPHAGTQYILVEDNEGNCSRKFKQFVTSFEHSNNCEAVWGDGFANQFTNKKIGGVYGEVENEYNGKVTMRRELRWFCNDESADTAAIPNPKYLDKPSASSTTDSGFIAVPDGDENDLPF